MASEKKMCYILSCFCFQVDELSFDSNSSNAVNSHAGKCKKWEIIFTTSIYTCSMLAFKN